MRVLVDPETGELVEVVPEAVLGPAAPYDYADYRRANMAASREHREALKTLAERETEAGVAEGEYRKQLALTVPRMKAEHGATVAEAMAKGQPEVVEAHTKKLAADALARAAMEKVRLCRDDRSALLTMGAWSREADPDGWKQAGGK